MEVDDAIASAEDKTVLKSSTVDNKEQQIMPSSSSNRHKRLKLRHEKEEPPGEDLLDTAKNESLFTATPIKLEVSASEEEEDDDDGGENDNADASGGELPTKSSIRRKVFASPLPEQGDETIDGLDDCEDVEVERKRYEVRRSGSEECLLGFDEQSGEAELIKTVKVENNEEIEEEIILPLPILEIKVEKTSPTSKSSPVSSPVSSTSMKKSPSQTSTQSPLSKASQSPQQGRRSVSKSPFDLKPKLPLVETTAQKTTALKTSPKSHIVGDAEETNGQMDNVAVKTAPAVNAVTPGHGARRTLSPQDDFYKKPFEYGWKRELVWRANLETSKDKADVYFISPAGKKLRGRNEIAPLLEDGLTIEHFCFVREPLGASPDLEIVRSAKPSARASIATATLAAAPPPPVVGKRVSKPKVPKGASPPPQGWTPSKALKVNNAALLSASGGLGRTSTSSQNQLSPSVTTPPSHRKHDSNAHNSSHSTKSSSKAKKHVNDIENDLKQINESIRRSRKHSNNSQEGSVHSNHNSHNSQAGSDHSSKLFATNFFANVSYAYDSLLCVLKYLKIHERPHAAAVCKLWHLAAKDTALWQTVRMKNSKVCSWSGFAAALRRGETKHLDLRKMLLPSGRSEDFWNDFCENIGSVCLLENIDLCRCSARVVESLFQSNRHLKVINALAINDDAINLENVHEMAELEELRLRTCESAVLTGDIVNLASLSKLTHLSLTSIKGLGAKSVEVLGGLTTLKSLELGECGDFDSTFGEAVLPKLVNLERLRLENGQVVNVCTLEVLDAVARLVQLNQLELVNFDIKPGFDKKLSLCINITKLLIIPTYISQSATTNQIVLSAVQKVADTLKVFTWCVTVELLRVTALYVDQCEESTKKEKHHFDECIPVLKPVPGAPPPDKDNVDNTKNLNAHEENPPDVPQIEILPLDKVETILSENLPNTKFTIVKVPYQFTCKQQLVD